MVTSAAADISEPDGAQEVALSRVRQIIGRRLGASKRDAPHFYVTGEFDLETALVRLKSFPPPQPRVNDLIQFLTVQTLRQVPALNATFAGDRLLHYDAVNLAIAVAREDGLITPVIHKADRFSLTGLAAESREIIERTRINRLLADDLLGGTFTISNLGVIKQVDHFTAVINPPQVAILAVGTVKRRPIVLDDGLFIHHTVYLTLSGDHRVVDGMHLGQFMATFQEKLDRFNQGQEI
jgi:pyruvate dehydrogenase E2 component (dihydrolipoamide acetyltransferase)